MRQDKVKAMVNNDIEDDLEPHSILNYEYTIIYNDYQKEKQICYYLGFYDIQEYEKYKKFIYYYEMAGEWVDINYFKITFNIKIQMECI